MTHRKMRLCFVLNSIKRKFSSRYKNDKQIENSVCLFFFLQNYSFQENLSEANTIYADFFKKEEVIVPFLVFGKWIKNSWNANVVQDMSYMTSWLNYNLG